MDIEIRITLSAHDVVKLIGQHPMGRLDKPIPVRINGQFVETICESYVCTDGEAQLTLRSVEHECLSTWTADGHGAYCKVCGETLA